MYVDYLPLAASRDLADDIDNFVYTVKDNYN